ncbi:unnamed protein product [Cyprideis torosa]|uniref:Uncharacterized protein n=1 Tax=Cyprideis torosa TaxID=163714 RepID=A0A7R8WHD4_9CRUS|nr:unnamed protein product [Cyprideis torosa]CAG0896485.1 unnamed protein product [Cyprideis torosa]
MYLIEIIMKTIISPRILTRFRFVPASPVTRLPVKRSEVQMTAKMIEHLERLSLVDFATEEGLRRVEETLEQCQCFSSVDTRGVEPLVTLLEDGHLPLAEDQVVEQSKTKILSTASRTEDGYFVAPPGNIPLERQAKSYDNRQTDPKT